VLVQRVHEQNGATQLNGRDALDAWTHGCSPREIDLPGRQWDIAQHFRECTRHGLRKRSHRTPILPLTIMTAVRLVLASSSPRRAELLRAAGITFETCAVDIDESWHPGESAASYVRRVAMEKSQRALERLRLPQGDERRLDNLVVLGADTAVVVDGEILGKPRDRQDAALMLRRLSGRRHDVMTGVSLRAGGRESGCVENTGVYFAVLSDLDVSWYVDSGEGLDKAGAYAIQGLASRFIQRIEGSYANVVGLPVAAVCELLRTLNSSG
jgi:nucleoside triphosphate pyrophosphatase